MPSLDDEDRGGGEERTWFEYRRLILSELERISAALGAVDAKIERLRSDDISRLKVDVAMLQVKSGIWGALGGIAVAIGAVLIKMVGG